MNNFLLIIALSFIFIGCKNKSDINDKSKRNPEWAWWVDIQTGKGSWIHAGNTTTVEGRLTFFYSNGNIYEEAKFVNGKYIDTTYFYDLQGKLSYYRLMNPNSTCNFIINNKTDTICDYVFNNGILKVYQANGTLFQEAVIKNHVYNGLCTYYYWDGNKQFLRNFVKDSAWRIEYYENGQEKDSSYDFNYIGDFLSCKKWYDNGQIEEETQRKNGLKDGIIIRYYDNGMIKGTMEWKNGLQDGITISYYENGQMEDSFQDIKGEQDGIGKGWYRNGQLKWDATYVNNHIIHAKEYDEQGILISDSTAK